MTEDAGPPGPVERFSSLPIREADAATAAGTERSELIIRCDMSQAFGTGVRHPTGNSTAGSGCAAAGAGVLVSQSTWFPRAIGFPDKLSRSLPSRPDPVRIVSLEYGLVFGLTQARQRHRWRPA